MTSQPYENAQERGAQAVVQITLGQVYNEVRQTHEAVQGLVQGLEPIKNTIADHETRLRNVDGLPADVEELETQVADHEARLRNVDGTPAAVAELKVNQVRLEGRVRRVEWRQGMWAGGAAVFAGSAGSLITWALTRH